MFRPSSTTIGTRLSVHALLALTVLLCATTTAFAQVKEPGFLERVDVDGDGVNTPGDAELVTWWLFHGGNWDDLTAAVPDPALPIYDLSEFFASEQAHIDNPIGVLVGTGAGAGSGGSYESWQFVRGDVNRDWQVDVTDPIVLNAYLFASGPPPANLDAADANDDGQHDVSDSVTILNFLFSYGDEFPQPFPQVGIDPTLDTLDSGGPDPAVVEPQSPTSQSVTAGTIVDLEVDVVSLAGVGQADVAVEFELNGSGEIIGGASTVISDSGGSAAISLETGIMPEVVTLAARVAGLDPVVFTITTTPLPDDPAPLVVTQEPFSLPLLLGEVARENLVVQNLGETDLELVGVEILPTLDHELFYIDEIFPELPMTVGIGSLHFVTIHGVSERLGPHHLDVAYTFASGEQFVHRLDFEVRHGAIAAFPSSVNFPTRPLEITSQLIEVECLAVSPGPLVITDVDLPAGFSVVGVEFPLEIPAGTTYPIEVDCHADGYAEETVHSSLVFESNVSRTYDGLPGQTAVDCQQILSPGASFSAALFTVPSSAIGRSLDIDDLYAESATISVVDPTVGGIQDSGTTVSELQGLGDGAILSFFGQQLGQTTVEVYLETTPPVLLARAPFVVSPDTRVARLARIYEDVGGTWFSVEDRIQFLTVPGWSLDHDHLLPEGTLKRGTDLVEAEFGGTRVGILHSDTQVYVYDLSTGAAIHHAPPISLMTSHTLDFSRSAPGLDPLVVPLDSTGQPGLSVCVTNRGGELFFVDPIAGTVWGMVQLPQELDPISLMGEDIDLQFMPASAEGPACVIALTLPGEAYAIEVPSLTVTSLGSVQYDGEQPAARLACDPVVAGDSVGFVGVAGKCHLARRSGGGWIQSDYLPGLLTDSDPAWDVSFDEGDLVPTPDGYRWVYQTWSGHAYVLNEVFEREHVLEGPLEGNSIPGVDPIIARYDPSTQDLTEARVICTFHNGIVRITDLADTIRWTFQLESTWTENLDVQVTQDESRAVFRHDEGFVVVRLHDGVVEQLASTQSLGVPVDGVDPIILPGGDRMIELLTRPADATTRVLIHGISPSTAGEMHELRLPAGLPPKGDVDLNYFPAGEFGIVQDRRGGMVLFNLEGEVIQVVQQPAIHSAGLTGVDFWVDGGLLSPNSDEDCIVSVPHLSPTIQDGTEGDYDDWTPEREDPPYDVQNPTGTGLPLPPSSAVTDQSTSPTGDDTGPLPVPPGEPLQQPGLSDMCSEDICICVGEEYIFSAASEALSGCTVVLVDADMLATNCSGDDVIAVTTAGPSAWVITGCKSGEKTIQFRITCPIPDSSEVVTKLLNLTFHVMCPKKLTLTVVPPPGAGPAACFDAVKDRSDSDGFTTEPDAESCLVVPCESPVMVDVEFDQQGECGPSDGGYPMQFVPDPPGTTSQTAVHHECKDFINTPIDSSGMGVWTPSPSDLGRSFIARVGCGADGTHCELGDIAVFVTGLDGVSGPRSAHIGDEVVLTAKPLFPTLNPCLRGNGTMQFFNQQIAQLFEQYPVQWEFVQPSTSGCGPSSSLTGPEFAFLPKCGGTFTVRATWLGCTIETEVVVDPAPEYVGTYEQPPVEEMEAIADPVLPHSGEFMETQTDLVVPSTGIDFTWIRRYKSQAGASRSPIGRNWDFNYNQRVVNDSTGVSHYALFQHTRYEIDSAAPTGYRTPDGHASVLRSFGGYYQIRTSDGQITSFHAGGPNQGLLYSIADPNGNIMTFAYQDRKLIKIKDTLNRSYTVTWEDDRIVSLEDFCGRVVEYTYYEFQESGGTYGLLKSVRTPVVTGTVTQDDFPSGRRTFFRYDEYPAHQEMIGNLTAIIRPNEVADGSMTPQVELEYGTDRNDSDTYDRVLTSKVGGANPSAPAAGGSFHFYYTSLMESGSASGLDEEVRWTTMVDRAGNVSRYYFNKNFSLLKKRVYTGRVPALDYRLPYPLSASRGTAVRDAEVDHPSYFHQLVAGPGRPGPESNQFYEWSYRYNKHNTRIETIFPEGNRIVCEYPYADSDNPFIRMNVTRKTYYADTRGVALDPDLHGKTPPVERSETFAYEPWTNKLAMVRDERGSLAGFSAPSEGGGPTPERYETTWVFDYQEFDETFIVDSILEPWGIVEAGEPLGSVEGLPPFFAGGLGDQAGNGFMAGGNPIRVDYATSTVLAPDQPVVMQAASMHRSYNSFGLITKEIDAEDNTFLYTYYPVGDPDGEGGTTTHSDSGGGYRASKTGPEGRTVTVEYYPFGMTRRQRDGRGVVTEFERNQLGELIQTTLAQSVEGIQEPSEELVEPLGYTHRYFYDHNGNRRRIEELNVGSATSMDMQYFVTEFEHDILNNVVARHISKRDGTEATWMFDYDHNENLVRATKPEGNSDSWTYDERDLLDLTIQGSSDPNEARQTIIRQTYDGNGNLRFVLDSEDNDGDGYPEVTEYQYDGWDRLAAIIDAAGQSRRFYYDVAGNRTLTESWGVVGGETPIRGGGTTMVLLQEVRHDYDERSRRIRERQTIIGDPLDSHTRDGDSDGVTEEYLVHDALNRVVRTVNDRGHDRIVSYNGLGEIDSVESAIGASGQRSKVTADRDRAGNVWKATIEDRRPDGSVETYVKYEYYDALDRVRRTIEPSGEARYFWYDSRGNLSVRTDAMGPPTASYPSGVPGGLSVNDPGNTVRYHWDELGRLTHTHRDQRVGGVRTDAQPLVAHLDPTVEPNPADLDPNNGVIVEEVVYDDNSRVLQRFDDRLNVTQYSYGHRDEVDTVTYADGTTYIQEYDRDHNMIYSQDSRQVEKFIQYDVLNRATRVSLDYSSSLEVGGTTEYLAEWDGLGRLTYCFDNNDPTTLVDDHEVWIEYDSLNHPYRERQDLRLVERYFDSMGNVESVFYTDGRELTRTFDSMDRLEAVEWQTGHSKGFSPLSDSAYIGSGRRLDDVALGNGSTVSYAYDSSRRLQSIVAETPSTLIFGRDYFYDQNSNKVAERYLDDVDAFGAPRGRIFEFDSASRVVAATSAFLDQYGAYQAPGTQIANESWALDGAHNWESYIKSGVERTTTHGSRNEIDTQTVGAQQIAFEHDANGNVTDDGRYECTYDGFGRMIRAYSPTTQEEWIYEYDGLDRRVAVLDLSDPMATSLTEYVYDGQHVIEEHFSTSGASEVTRNFYGDTIDSLIARETPTGDLQWYYRDNVGSVGALADETGTVLDRYRYSIYGQVEVIDVDQQGVEDNPFLFQSRRLDATGLYYYRARQYNPDIGRFYQLDPGNDAMAFGNGYAFVGSNPGSYWDPYGESGWGLWDAVCDFVSDAVDMVGDALSAAGEMIGEFAAGVVEGVVGSIKGIVNAALHPIDTLNGLIELAKTIAGDPKAFLDQLIKELSQMTPAEMARALGRLTGEVVAGMATGGMTSAIGRGASFGNRARRFANRSGASSKGSCQGDKCFVGDTLVSTPTGDRPIDEIRVGQRVHSRAHADSVSAATLGRDCDESDGPIETKPPEEPQLAISLTVTGATGTVYEIELLRSAEWLDENRAEDGRVFLRLDELGLLGWATVETVRPAEVDEGPGGLVTATIVSTSRVLYDVTVGDDVIRATGRHPVFSLDRDAWVPVAALRRGERLASESGEAVAVLDIERLVVTGTKVYNIEVDGTHAYHVGTAGVLVHNAGECGGSGGSPALRGDPYHPDSVEVRVRPPYRANPAHDTRSPSYNPNKTPEPADAADVWNSGDVERSGMGTWFGTGENGDVYRFSDTNDGSVHFSGTIPPSQINNVVPNDVQKSLGIR